MVSLIDKICLLCLFGIISLSIGWYVGNNQIEAVDYLSSYQHEQIIDFLNQLLGEEKKQTELQEYQVCKLINIGDCEFGYSDLLHTIQNKTVIGKIKESAFIGMYKTGVCLYWFGGSYGYAWTSLQCPKDATPKIIDNDWTLILREDDENEGRFYCHFVNKKDPSYIITPRCY